MTIPGGRSRGGRRRAPVSRRGPRPPKRGSRAEEAPETAEVRETSPAFDPELFGSLDLTDLLAAGLTQEDVRRILQDLARAITLRRPSAWARLEETVPEILFELMLERIGVAERPTDLSRIAQALYSLGPEIRPVVIPVVYAGRTIEEVARRLGMPAASAKARLARGLHELRESLTEGSPEPKPALAAANVVPFRRKAP